MIIDLTAPTAASSVKIWNDSKQAINVQVRIFRWSQSNGAESYTPTKEVVVSPPITSLKPGKENILRIVRTSKNPVVGEESYRMIIDELPGANRKQAGSVALVVRHSIPVFFGPADTTPASPQWKLLRKPGGYSVSVTNQGGKRLKLFDLTLNSNGKIIAKRDGLIGYALAGSTAGWFIPANTKNKASGTAIKLAANSEAGMIHVTVPLSGN